MKQLWSKKQISSNREEEKRKDNLFFFEKKEKTKRVKMKTLPQKKTVFFKPTPRRKGPPYGEEEVVVVVVRTFSLYDVSVHATQQYAPNSGDRSPGSQTPGDPATPSPPRRRGSNPGPVPVHRALPTIASELHAA